MLRHGANIARLRESMDGTRALQDGHKAAALELRWYRLVLVPFKSAINLHADASDRKNLDTRFLLEFPSHAFDNRAYSTSSLVWIAHVAFGVSACVVRYAGEQ